ncbi:hypothetical protein DFH27DRAFT_567487 [Peziza echinospora]|nr:hypothetical protein DFH27DRAFT_567487 [Peziza echinospora]
MSSTTSSSAGAGGQDRGTTVIKTHALRRATSMPFGRQYHATGSGGLAAAKDVAAGSQGDRGAGKSQCQYEQSVLQQSATVTAESGAGTVAGGGDNPSPLKLRPRAPTAGPSFGGGGSGAGNVGLSTTANENIEVLFSHTQTRITSFNTEIDKKKTSDINIAEPEALIPYTGRGERLLASGLLRLYRAKPHNIAFIQSGGLLHPVMARSQCWCVDQEDDLEEGEVEGLYQARRDPRGLFVLKIRSGLYWRIEITSSRGEKQPGTIQTFKKVLKNVLAYEKTTCPFQRKMGFDVGCEEDVDEVEEEVVEAEPELLRRKVPWRMKRLENEVSPPVGKGKEVEAVPITRKLEGPVSENTTLDLPVETKQESLTTSNELKTSKKEPDPVVAAVDKTIKTEITYTAIPSPTALTPKARRQRGRASPSSPRVRSRATSPRPTTSSSQYMSPVLESFDDLLMSSPGSPSTPTQPFMHRPSTPYRSSSMRINTHNRTISGIGYASPTSSVSSLPMLCTSATSSSSFSSSSYLSSSPPPPPAPQFSQMDINDWTHIITKPPSPSSRSSLLSSTSRPTSSRSSSVNPSSSFMLRKPLPISPVTTKFTSTAMPTAPSGSTTASSSTYNPLPAPRPTAESFFAKLHPYNANHFPAAPAPDARPSLRKAVSQASFPHLSSTSSTSSRSSSHSSSSSSNSHNPTTTFLVTLMLGIANRITSGAISLGEMLEEGLLGENQNHNNGFFSDDEGSGSEDDEELQLEEDWGSEGWEEDFGFGFGFGNGFGSFVAEVDSGALGVGMGWSERRARAIALRRVGGVERV